MSNVACSGGLVLSAKAAVSDTMPDVPELTEERLRELLQNPRCPFGIEPGRNRSTRLIGLPDLLTFAEAEVGPQEGLEEQLDLLMTRISVERLPVTDPWTAPRRFLRRLRGRPNPRQVGYAVPTELTRS